MSSDSDELKRVLSIQASLSEREKERGIKT